MSGKKRTEAWDRAHKAAGQIKPMAAQMKPLAKSTGHAARRQLFRTRAWAAPRVERTGKVLQDTVAPKVSAVLSSAADRIDPAKPKRGRWRLPVGIATAVTAAASAAAAVLRNRSKTETAQATGAHIDGTDDMPDIEVTKTEPIVEDKQAHVG
jgi:hypothetical protein